MPDWRLNGDLRPMFLLAQPLVEVATVPITVIVNWPRLLKRSRRAMRTTNHLLACRRERAAQLIDSAS